MEGEPPKKSKHKHKKRRPVTSRLTPEEEYQSLLDRDFRIPGIVKLILGEKTQKDLHCVVGEDITSEHQWVFVKKELIEDSLILNEESEFLPHRLDIVTYPRAEILIGYAPNEFAEFDEFYLCATENVTDKIDALVQNVRAEQESRVDRSLNKVGRGWTSFGSEGELEDPEGRAKRARLEVELETAYPVMSPKVFFKFRHVDDARDGYAEILQTRLPIESVVKKRIDTGVQVSPCYVEEYAQTNYSFKKSASTQYFYDYEEKEVIDSEIIEGMKSFNSTDLEDLCEQILINGNINFYSDDYLNLVTDEKYTSVPKDILFVEYLSFKELDLTRNKKICSACWSPILTGTVAIAYGKIAANMKSHGKSRTDPNAVVHQINPILIWCTNDALNPKLILECHRSVEVISLCPFNKNVVIGGSINGQILVWDITNRIEKVEEVEVLTSTQRKHRVLLTSFMEWMKDIRDITRVRTTAQSNLVHSHNAPINQIHWLPPSCRITKLGKFELVDEGEPFTMQFASSALDGYVMFWDLLAKPVMIIGHGPRKKSFRLKVRPSGLAVDASPFKLLDRLLTPVYKLNSYNMKKTRPFFLTTMGRFPLDIKYENPHPEVPIKMAARVEHTITHRPLEDLNLQFALGSTLGYFFRVGWEGYDVNPGEIVNKESAKVNYIARYHDEPVNTVAPHPSLPNIYLTVGGKIFAIWKTTLKNTPLIWRSSRNRYMHGEWSNVFQGNVRLVLDNGAVEMWFFCMRTDKPYITHYLSGNTILSTQLHPFQCGNFAIMGSSDFDASYRLYKIQVTGAMITMFGSENFDAFLDKEVERKKAFFAWQKSWLKKHPELVEERNEKITVYRKQKMQREEAENEALEQLRKKEEAEQNAQVTKPLPGQYMEWAREQRLISEEKRMKNVLLRKKQLNPDLLTEQQRPLKLFEKAEQRKKKKQKDLLQMADEIFQDRVAMLFPEALKKKLPPPLDPYASEDNVVLKRQCLDEYNTLSQRANLYIEGHEFIYDFDWKQLTRSRIRRRRITEQSMYQLRNVDLKLTRSREKSETSAEETDMYQLRNTDLKLTRSREKSETSAEETDMYQLRNADLKLTRSRGKSETSVEETTYSLEAEAEGSRSFI